MNFFSYKIPKNFYPLLYFFTFIFILFLKIFEKKIPSYFFFALAFIFFVSVLILIYFSNFLKIPNFFYPFGILVFLILFFISFFYFFPFNPPPFERRGQNFLVISLEGFRYDSIKNMPYLNKFKENGAYFSYLYLSSPDFKINLEKLFNQKNLSLLKFYPERYEKLALVPEELKDNQTAKIFDKRLIFNEKHFYSFVLSNWFFLKIFMKEKNVKLEQIFNFSLEKIESTSRPFFIWLHINNLKHSIPEDLKIKTLEGINYDEKILKENYFKNIFYLDLSFEKFFQRLEVNKWYEKTNILILGVSGFELLEHKRLGTGTSYYQESILVPFIWIGPNIPKKEIKNPISILDIYPTILKKFNLSENWKNFEGIEFTPSFQNIFPLERTFIFKDNYLYFKGKAFLREDKKVIICGNKIEVYDLQKDPEEKENIFYIKDEKIIKFVEEVKNL